MKIQPVILCGGAGNRLWPLSRLDRPKQFAPLVGAETTFQAALARLDGEGVAPPIVVSSPDYRDLILEQAAAVGLSPELILEPEPRDSAPAIAAAAAYVAERYPDRTLVVQPADHRILDRQGFRRSVERAVEAAARQAIVTFGIPPAYASTAYGYIKPAAGIEGLEDAAWVERFVEKPQQAVAEGYLREGYLWNSGIFVFTPQTFARELGLAAPAMAEAAAAAVRDACRGEGELRLDPAGFSRAPKLSIDYALLEHTRVAAVVPAAFDWSDLGTWPSLKEVLEGDADGNILNGEAVVALDSRNCFIRGDGRPVVVVGGQDLSVVVEADAVLVCADAAAPQMKTALERLKAAGRPEAVRGSPRAAAVRPPASLEEGAARLADWLRFSALPLWCSFGVDYDGFGFFEGLDRQARPLRGPRRFRVQPRQLYVFTAAGEMGWPGPWRQAAQRGLDAMLTRFRRSDGLFRTLVADDGAPLDDSAVLYDQAFALFGLGHAAKAGLAPAGELESLAQACRAAIDAQFRLPSADLPKGWLAEIGDAQSQRQSNPLMHLLEASLLWEQVGSDPAWVALADEVVDMALGRFIDPTGGFLREHVGPQGLRDDALGRLVEPGHQFEWAWLLSIWAGRRDSAKVLAAARRLYEVGLRGVDPARGVAVDALNDDLTIRSAQARLWPQTEWLKAAVALGGEAAPAGQALQQYLDVLPLGLWRDKLRPNGLFVNEMSPASSLYHIIGGLIVLNSAIVETNGD